MAMVQQGQHDAVFAAGAAEAVRRPGVRGTSFSRRRGMVEGTSLVGWVTAHGGVREHDELPAGDVAGLEPGHPDGAGRRCASEEDVQRGADGRAGALEARLVVRRMVFSCHSAAY